MEPLNKWPKSSTLYCELPLSPVSSALCQRDAVHPLLTFFWAGEVSSSGYYGFYSGVAVLFLGFALSCFSIGTSAAALLSMVAFLVNKKGTHELDLDRGPLLQRLSGLAQPLTWLLTPAGGLLPVRLEDRGPLLVFFFFPLPRLALQDRQQRGL